MRINKSDMLLYAVTDRCGKDYDEFISRVETALKNGATCLQLREKNLDYADFLREAQTVKALCRRYGVPFIINDNVALALEIGADGVHVGQEDMNALDVRKAAEDRLIVGVSAHNVKEALEAQAAGADYLGCGSVFTTATKNNVTSLGCDELKKICHSVDIPVVAIGGINAGNIMNLAGSGIDGVAVASAIFGAHDVAPACSELRNLSEKAVNTVE